MFYLILAIASFFLGVVLHPILHGKTRALALMDADTQVIPGHGALSNREDLREYRDALKTMRDAVADLMERGRSLQQIINARPIRAQAEAWGQSEEAEESFVETIHHGLGGP